jgi:predicted DNA binding CopG/RHH family protein
MPKMKNKIDAKKLPDFKKMTDEQIAEFWDTHDASEFWADMEDAKESFRDVRPKKSISLRIDEDALSDLKKLANSKGLGYQTLMRMWIIERLHKERRKTA